MLKLIDYWTATLKNIHFHLKLTTILCHYSLKYNDMYLKIYLRWLLYVSFTLTVCLHCPTHRHRRIRKITYVEKCTQRDWWKFPLGSVYFYHYLYRLRCWALVNEPYIWLKYPTSDSVLSWSVRTYRWEVIGIFLLLGKSVGSRIHWTSPSTRARGFTDSRWLGVQRCCLSRFVRIDHCHQFNAQNLILIITQKYLIKTKK